MPFVLATSYGATFSMGVIDINPAPIKSVGSVSSGNTEDIYNFQIESKSEVEVSFSKISGNVLLKLKDSEGTTIAESAKKKKKSSIEIELNPGEYSIEVILDQSKTVNYTMETQAEFVTDDVVVSGTQNVQDPEFDSATLKTTWRDGTNLYVANINPENGFIDFNSRLLLDSTIAPIQEVINGPEWASARDGDSRILYTDTTPAGWTVNQARLNENDEWVITNVPGTVNGFKPIGSSDDQAAIPFVKYEIGVAGDRAGGMAWKELNSPYEGANFPDWAIAGRFVPGYEAYVCSKEISGYYQLVWYDLASGDYTPLTTGKTHKVLPFAVKAPEFGGDIVITAPETKNIAERGYFDAIVVYREVNGQWQMIKRIPSPSKELKGIHSAEPFVFNGKTYISFLALNAVSSQSKRRKLDAEVWIASADPADNFMRKVSGEGKTRRSDPESLITETEVFIYYTELLDRTRPQHRTSTGLKITPQ